MAQGGMRGVFNNVFGGGGHDDPPADDSQNETLNNNDDGTGDGNEESSYDAFASLFGDDDGGDEGQQQQQQESGDGQQRQQQQQQTSQNRQQQNGGDDNGGGGNDEETALAGELANMLKGINVGEDMIPENFDPSDPKQFRDVLGKVQQQTAQATLQMAMRPMQLAMSNMLTHMREEIQSAVRNATGESKNEAALHALVPEANDPKLNGLVTTLHKQSLSKAKNPQQAAQMVRRALDAMGIKSSGGGSNQDPSEGGLRSGNNALDLYAPLKPRTPVKKSA